MLWKGQTEEQQVVFIMVKHLRYELLEFKHFPGYVKVINNIVKEIEDAERRYDYKKIMEECDKGMSDVKSYTGNHFHIYLFNLLKKFCKKIIEKGD